MAKKKDINFGKVKPVAPIRQAQNTNGQVGERLVWTSVDIDTELYRGLKIYLVEKGISMKDFFMYWISKALQGELPLPIPKEEKSQNFTKRTFYIPESTKINLKKWLTTNDVVMRDMVEYAIKQELSRKQV